MWTGLAPLVSMPLILRPHDGQSAAPESHTTPPKPATTPRLHKIKPPQRNSHIHSETHRK
jgi:hypothetical protein